MIDMVHKNVNMIPARQAQRTAILALYNDANDEILRLGALVRSCKAGNSKKPAPKRVITRIKRLFEARQIAWDIQARITEVDAAGNFVIPEVPKLELWSLMKGQDIATLSKMGTYHKKYKGRMGALYSPKKGGARQ